MCSQNYFGLPLRTRLCLFLPLPEHVPRSPALLPASAYPSCSLAWGDVWMVGAGVSPPPHRLLWRQKSRGKSFSLGMFGSPPSDLVLWWSLGSPLHCSLLLRGSSPHLLSVMLEQLASPCALFQRRVAMSSLPHLALVGGWLGLLYPFFPACPLA